MDIKPGKYLLISEKFPDFPLCFSSLKKAEKAKIEMEKEHPEYKISIMAAPISPTDPHENSHSNIHPGMSVFPEGPVYINTTLPSLYSHGASGPYPTGPSFNNDSSYSSDS